jgi:transcriptional regulator with XRE-family HTH domain
MAVLYGRQIRRTKLWRTPVGVGVRISELRLKSRQSLQDVADAVGVSKAHIWELEKGRTDNPSMALVTRLADHFGVSIRYLVGEDVDADDGDEELARMFRQASKLAPEDRAILDDIMQSMLKRRSGNAG